MAFQIPKGDNLGNVGPQVGRTRIQGGDSPIGRAMVGFGRDVQRIGLQLEQEKEQVNQVEMRNAVLNREKQVNSLKNSIDERVKMGDLDPESAVEEYKKQLATLPKQEIKGLNGKQQETLNYYYNATDYQGEQQALGIYKQGITVKAQNALSEYIRLANEDPNNNIDTTLAGFDSEPMQQTIRTAYGQKAGEATAQFKRELLLNNLQNKATLAADSSNYKALKQLKADAANPEFYKGILQNDDRVKLAHNAKLAMKRMESEWKAAQAQLKSDISYSDQNVLAASANGDLLDNPYTEKDYINAFGQKDGSRRYKNVTEWRTEVAPKILSYKGMSVADIVKDVDSSKPIDKDHDMYASQDRVHKFKAAAAQQVINEKINNPFNAAVKSGLFKPFDSANPDDMTNEIARRYAAQPELRKIDINAPLLSKGEADMLSQSIRGSKNTDVQIALLKGLGEKLPPEAVKGVAAQIAPDSAAVAFSSMLLNAPDTSNRAIGYKEMSINDAVSKAFDPKERNKPRSANDLITTTIDKNEAVKTILQGDQLLNPTEAMKKSGVSKVSLPSDNKLKESFNSYVGNAFQHNPQAYQLTFDVYKSAYAGLAYRSGDIDDIKTDIVSEDIAKKAALMATGGVTKNASNVWGVATSKKAVVMPYGMDESAFRDKYKAASIQSLKEAGLNYNGWDDLTPVNVGNNTYRLAYGNTGRWAINPKTGSFVTVEIE